MRSRRSISVGPKTQKVETIFCGKSVFGVNVGALCPVAELVSKSGDRSGIAFSIHAILYRLDRAKVPKEAGGIFKILNHPASRNLNAARAMP
jgi:hypothetical protein